MSDLLNYYQNKLTQLTESSSKVERRKIIIEAVTAKCFATPDEIYDDPILIDFILDDDLEMVKFLLDHGADPNRHTHSRLNIRHGSETTNNQKPIDSIRSLEMAKLLHQYGMKFSLRLDTGTVGNMKYHPNVGTVNAINSVIKFILPPELIYFYHSIGVPIVGGNGIFDTIDPFFMYTKVHLPMEVNLDSDYGKYLVEILRALFSIGCRLGNKLKTVLYDDSIGPKTVLDELSENNCHKMISVFRNCIAERIQAFLKVFDNCSPSFSSLSPSPSSLLPLPSPLPPSPPLPLASSFSSSSFSSSTLLVSSFSSLSSSSSTSSLSTLIAPLIGIIYSYWCEDDYSGWSSPLFVSRHHHTIPQINEMCWYCLLMLNRENTKRFIKITKCEKCSTVQYCGKSCKEKDWPLHQPFCNFKTSSLGFLVQ